MRNLNLKPFQEKIDKAIAWEREVINFLKKYESDHANGELLGNIAA